MSANLLSGSIKIHCLILLVHPPLVRFISRLISFVLNLEVIDTILFLTSDTFLPLNIMSNKHLAIISFFCSNNLSLSSLKNLTNFKAFSIICICLVFSTFNNNAMSSAFKR